MKIKLLLAQVFLLILIYGCSKPCDAPNGNRGIIVKDYNEDDYPCWQFSQNRFLIRNDSQYKATFNLRTDDNCSGRTLTEVDFDQYSLIGLHASAGSEDNFLKTVTRDDNSKKVIYEVQTNNCPGVRTDELVASPNIVYIPKVPDDYTAEYIFTEIND